MHISMYIYLFLDYAKLALFSAETLRKTHLSAGYRYFFTKFAADFNKTELDKVSDRGIDGNKCKSKAIQITENFRNERRSSFLFVYLLRNFGIFI